MAKASEPVLAWLRTMLDKRGLNTAAVAEKAGLPRARVRKVLTGADDMTVDELLKLTTALQISPADLGLPGAPAEADEPAAVAVADAPPEWTPNVDPWGNHPEQLFRIGFALGCDFLFLLDPAQLADSGLPAFVLQQYQSSPLPIKLDAMYHQHNAPRYGERGVTLTLSFDALYDCTFPWSSVRQVVFFPVPVEPAAPPPEEPKGPRLRLVE
jgi:transcriptional regulator with XRE-family HTH domain